MTTRNIDDHLSIVDMCSRTARFSRPQSARYVLQASTSLSMSPGWIDVAQHGELVIYCYCYDDDDKSNTFWGKRYDSYNQVWKPTPHSPWSWSRPQLAMLGEFIYAFGGRSRDNACQTTDSVARLHPNVGVWEDLPPMLDCRADAGSAVLDGRLYVFGGSMEVRLGVMHVHNSAECFYPASNEWHRLPTMLQPRHRPRGVVVIDSLVYIVDGIDYDDFALLMMALI